MKKYFIDGVVFWNNGQEQMRGFYLTIDDEKALLEVPSDIYGDKSNLYEEEITLEQEIFEAEHTTGEHIHIMDGEIIGEEII